MQLSKTVLTGGGSRVAAGWGEIEVRREASEAMRFSQLQKETSCEKDAVSCVPHPLCQGGRRRKEKIISYPCRSFQA